MNVKNNKRKKESIEKIEKVFIELIQKKEIDKISITDICKKANLNRSTFYSNFIDIYDLADKLKDKLENEVLSFYNVEFGYKNANEVFLRLFKHIKENQIFYKTYFKLNFHNKIDLSKIQLNYPLAQGYYDKHLDYHIEFFKAGMDAIIKKWIFSGCKESPEEISEIIKSEYTKEHF